MRQATTCYLYGLPSAATALCRTVLQFALEEAFATRGGISLHLSKIDRKDYLKKIINFARSSKVLSPRLTTTAHEIREAGNNSIHTSACNESEALTTIKKTGEVLEHIYGRTGQRGR